MIWNFLQVEPQNARGRLQEFMWDSPEYIVEEKFDGDRRIAQFSERFEVRFTGRKKSVKDGLFVEKTSNLPQLNQYQDLHLVGTILDGEMIVPPDFITGAGGKSKHVTSIMGSSPEEAIRKQHERGFLRFAAFDCLSYKTTDLRKYPLQLRKQYLQRAIEEWANPYAFAVPWTRENKREFLEEIYARGGEGVILKHELAKYGNGVGHLSWVKVKAEFNADVIVTNFKDAREMSKKVTGEVSITKYAAEGLIGAVVFSQYRDGELVEVGNTSGMDEETRRWITHNKEAVLGRVLEIKHYGREPTGKFRHPQFKRWRDDKNANECVWYKEEV